MTDDEKELLERRITDAVVGKVYPMALRTLIAVGTTVTAIFGFLGVNAYTTIVTMAETKAIAVSEGIRNGVKEAEREFDHKQSEFDRKIGSIETLQTRAETLASDVEGAVKGFKPKAAALETTITKIDSLDTSVKDIDASLQRIKQVAGSADFAIQITTQIKNLNDAVSLINDRMSAQADGRVPPTTSGVEVDGKDKADWSAALNKAYQSVSEKTAEVSGSNSALQQKVKDAQDRPTVYFQYTGSTSAEAKAVLTELRNAGYIAPAEDLEQGAAGQRVIRFFHADDSPKAEKLAAVASAILAKGGYGDKKVAVQDLTGYTGQKPRLNVVEFWADLSQNSRSP